MVSLAVCLRLIGCEMLVILSILASLLDKTSNTRNLVMLGLSILLSVLCIDMVTYVLPNQIAGFIYQSHDEYLHSVVTPPQKQT
ncbi:hypothetical protein VZ94_02755 [Methylocucumis oryzae]|uniref:Uncharacterized protein n=2 Tax=Methylocucumis oryzae TaxID=1632867 RepID=A0A0F3IMI0_9GAMM|nr:hypothetical protein VZ94_02755 [Methylocucumis oryzae]